MHERHPPEFDRALARLENVLAPIRTTMARARAEMASRRLPGPDAQALARAAQSDRAPADLKALAVAVRDGRTTWDKIAAGEADHLPEVERFYSASLARTRLVIQQWQQSDQPRQEGQSVASGRSGAEPAVKRPESGGTRS